MTHQGLDDGSIVGKFFVLTDKHAQLLVVDADVAFYHILRCFTIVVKVVFDKIEHHIRIVHGGFTITSLCKAIVVVPRLHYVQQLVHSVVEVAGGGVIGQHLPYFLFRESYHFVEFWGERVIGTDVEAASEVVHCNRADTGDETALDTGIGSCFHLVEEGAQIAFTMCLVGVTM